MSKRILFVALAGTLIPSAPVLAAIPRSQPSVPTVEALAMPLGNRVLMIRDQGPEGYRNLVKIMEDEKQTVELRWRAVTAIGRIGGAESKPELAKALSSREWYLRNAGLIAMAGIDRSEALVWARKLLSDKALMVRTAAVETIASFRDAESNELLWTKIYAPENYRGKQSLFIRRRIAESLAALEKKGAESRFVRLLEDQDASLHPSAVAALERLTAQKLGKPKDTLSSKRERWLAWGKQNSSKM